MFSLKLGFSLHNYCIEQMPIWLQLKLSHFEWRIDEQNVYTLSL